MHSIVVPSPEKETGVKSGFTTYNLFIGESYKKVLLPAEKRNKNSVLGLMAVENPE